MPASIGNVAVVGGGLAGARTCEQLRNRGFKGRITLVCGEAHLPYDRPPLSKGVLTSAVADPTFTIDYEALNVDVRLGVRATGLRPVDRILLTDTGDISYDGVVLATGAHPIRLPGEGEQLTVRTLDDAITLRERLTRGSRVVIIGASWIGAEVATAARASGCEVVCVERANFPVADVLGADVGKRFAEWWDGIDLRLGTAVSAVTSDGVLLADGSLLQADVVVTGVGVRPATEWLVGSGLALDRGVVTDEWLRAGPGVVAVGDLAAWWSRRYQQHVRSEHWDNAASGPAVAAAALLTAGLGERDTHDPVPYFWSDQFGHKIQYSGRHADGDRLIWRERAQGSWSAFWLDADNRLRAALVVDLPQKSTQAQIAITRDLALDPAMLADPNVPVSKALRR